MSCSFEIGPSVAARRTRAGAVGIAPRLGAALLFAMLVAACGQKGPLTLPKATAAAPASAASAASAP